MNDPDDAPGERPRARAKVRRASTTRGIHAGRGGTSGSAPNDYLKDAFAKAFREQADVIGRFNLGMFGKTGVGKSTLLNTIFGEDVAATGVGGPVTHGSHLHLHESGHLGILDTRGLEVGQDKDKILEELSEYLGDMRHKPMKDQIHLAWYCVRAQDRRFEEPEADIIKKLHELGLTVILVLTQVPMKDGVYHPDAVTLAEDIAARQLPIHGGVAFMTCAKPDDFSGLPSHGLEALLDATFHVAPAGVNRAINAAQKIDLERKSKEARKAIDTATALAAIAGASPIPFSDAAILVPIQLTMMASISHTYDVPLDRATSAALAATAAATTAGRSVVTNLLKFIPVAGWIVGGAINSGVAAAVTYAMGHAWLIVCQKITQGGLVAVGGALDSDAIRGLFVDEFKEQVRKRLPNSE